MRRRTWSTAPIDQLRHFVDIYSCGVALVGNEEIYSRFTRSIDGPSYAQIKSRIGKRLRLSKPRAEDINALLDAWALTDAEVRKVLTGIGIEAGRAAPDRQDDQAGGHARRRCGQADRCGHDPRRLGEPRRGGHVRWPALSRTSPISREIGLIAELVSQNMTEDGFTLPGDKAAVLLKRLELIKRAIAMLEHELGIHPRQGAGKRCGRAFLTTCAWKSCRAAFSTPPGTGRSSIRTSGRGKRP